MSLPKIKYVFTSLALSGGLACSLPSLAQQNNNDSVQNYNITLHSQPSFDIFESLDQAVTPQGTTDSRVLANAPSANIIVRGESKTASIVVDLTTNVLYQYNNQGQAIAAYSVASGNYRRNNGTPSGTYIVSHKEVYPYRNAPRSTLRYRNPNDYGPKIIILKRLNPQTGETSETGVFIHGNNNASSIGKYVSHGCIRMDNKVILKVADAVNRGDIIVFKENRNLR